MMKMIKKVMFIKFKCNDNEYNDSIDYIMHAFEIGLFCFVFAASISKCHIFIHINQVIVCYIFSINDNILLFIFFTLFLHVYLQFYSLFVFHFKKIQFFILCVFCIFYNLYCFVNYQWFNDC